ncbi:unnamed protein product [Prunus armeniaca]|nr:unnamed protein product [Prunus armeniaca]
MMTSLNFDAQDGILRSFSDAPPTHYTVKIQSLSLLAKNSLEKYESGDFEAGGKLVFYPNGNKSRNVKDHISLYLVMSGANATHISREVYAVFRLFLLDQNKGNYLVLQEQNERRFHGMKLNWGFDQFLSQKVFTEASNGFLLDDTSVFGAEIFVCKERSTCKGEYLSMVKDAVMYKHVWKIDNFSKLDAEFYDSKTFISGDQKWKIQLYPKGKGNGIGTHLSLYLALADPKSLPPGSKIYADITLRILDQVNARHQFGKGNFWFSASNPEWGWWRFITLGFLSQAGMGFLSKDTCIVEAEHLQSSTVVKFTTMSMNNLNFDDQYGILRTFSDSMPTHYTFKIQSFSLMSKHSLERYESEDFEAGGYKWKLAFYPNGNKSKNVKEHISLYLVLAGANGPQTCWEVYAAFRLFLLDQNNGKYLALQDFTDASNGFLVDDACVFGAEVFVRKERSTCKGECLSMIKDAVMKIEFYPEGRDDGKVYPSPRRSSVTAPVTLNMVLKLLGGSVPPVRRGAGRNSLHWDISVIRPWGIWRMMYHCGGRGHCAWNC